MLIIKEGRSIEHLNSVLERVRCKEANEDGATVASGEILKTAP